MSHHPIIQSYTQSDLFGRLIFLALLALSILSGIILVYKIWLTRRLQSVSREVEETFQKKQKSPLNIDFKELEDLVQMQNPLLNLYQALKKATSDLLRKNKAFLRSQIDNDKQPVFLSSSDIEQLAAYMSGFILSERKKLERYLFVLPTVVSLAPLLGLLGTVWGISVTFTQLPNGGALGNDAVLSGLSMALGTTVVGILVAIPALIAYNYLKQVVEDYSSQLEDFTSKMLSQIEILYRAVDLQPHLPKAYA